MLVSTAARVASLGEGERERCVTIAAVSPGSGLVYVYACIINGLGWGLTTGGTTREAVVRGSLGGE